LDLGIPWGTVPKREEDLSGMYTIMPNFTPIGATVVEISVTSGQIKKTQKT